MTDLASPPTYGQEEPTSDGTGPLQVLITPCTGATGFQNGYLGADNEHCSIEGEVQIKGAADREWDNIAVTFRTVESVESDEIELIVSRLVLFTAPKQSTSSQTSVSPPSSLPFSIPLTADIPQAVSTPYSSIAHTLVATLTPRTGEPITKSTEVPITRYTSAHASTSYLSVDPFTSTVVSPSHATMEIPRSVYRVGESIPLYVTIPPPERSAVASGLRLRNVTAELIRTIHVRSARLGSPNSDYIATVLEAEGSRAASTSMVYSPEKLPAADPGHATVLRRSGAACRFHSTRQIKLRLVLHDNESNTSGTITQDTLSHQISFHIQFTVAYTSGHSSPSSTTSIPIVILPQAAPPHQGDFSQEVDSAYRKKHDPPPARTYRMEDSQGVGSGELPSFDDPFPSSSSASAIRSRNMSFPPPPSFSEASASTSYANGLAPPPFDDAAGSRTATYGASLPPNFDGPPGPDVTDQNVPGGRLPSFIESESEAAAAAAREDGHDHSFGYWEFDPRTERQALHFPGEAALFGFAPAEQYDGLSHSMMQTGGSMDPQSDGSDSGSLYATTTDGGASFQRASATHLPLDIDAVPPPGIDESIVAAVSAAFASAGPGASVTVTSMNGGGIPPPPPPALDDPSDPPPSIDDGVHALSHAQQSRRERAMVEAAVARAVVGTVRENGQGAPPSVRIAVSSTTREEIRPPPYLGVPQSVAPPPGPPPYNG